MFSNIVYFCKKIDIFSGDRKRVGDRNGISLLEFMMNTSEVRTLQRMGFKRRTLKTMIKHQLQKTGKLLTRLSTCICVML